MQSFDLPMQEQASVPAHSHSSCPFIFDPMLLTEGVVEHLRLVIQRLSSMSKVLIPVLSTGTNQTVKQVNTG